MKLQIVAVITFTSILCGSLNSSYGQGQWKPWSSPTQKPLRLLGQGWSAGYHWRNPGHDSSYYNPYSAHNSYLLTGSSGYSGGGKCIGCNACNIACSVENNIPVVGKDQVEVGREMGWIRIDRYYQGTPEDPIVSNQPMLCQHCDNAPCENVCPVVATTHNKEGINQMVYNRCVGTRYCANNCPYKVRRFNFFDFRDRIANGYYKSESTKLAMNPEVTIRARGVMEKCTFCIQRISEAKQIAKQEGRQLKGSDVTTACQDACPSNAITFGSSNEEGSELVKMRNHNLGYHVLDYLNVVPNVTYIAKLRNIETEGVTSEHH